MKKIIKWVNRKYYSWLFSVQFENGFSYHTIKAHSLTMLELRHRAMLLMDEGFVRVSDPIETLFGYTVLYRKPI